LSKTKETDFLSQFELSKKRENELIASIDAQEVKLRELGIENGKLAALRTQAE